MQNIIFDVPVILCIVIGIALLVFEAFMPGFGVPGISGALLLFAAVTLLWINNGPLVGIAALIILLAIIGIVVSVLARSYAKGRLSKSSLILKGFSGKDLSKEPEQEMVSLEGKTGTTLTVLRPSGIAMIDDKRVNVVSNGDFISENTDIKVVSVEGKRVIVEKYNN